MRITGGELAGRRISAPRSNARPTADRVRESVFAILGDLSGAVVLDLCAGSGALGFESLSRGASSVVAIDRSAVSVACIRENARSLGLAERVRTRRMDALAALDRLRRSAERFDLVLIDPPYADGLAATVLRSPALRAILADAGQVVVESDRRHSLGDVPGSVAGLERDDERRYGDTLVRFYRARAKRPPSEEEDPIPMSDDSGRALFPASFDPLTNGHLDLVNRALRVFPRLVVAVARNVGKNGLFAAEERLEMLGEVLGDTPGVELSSFDGLVVDYANEIGVSTIVRGLRANADFEYEFEMALMNRHMRPDIETLFLMTSQEFFYVSSSRLKELVHFGADVSEWLPPGVEKRLQEKLGSAG